MFRKCPSILVLSSLFLLAAPQGGTSQVLLMGWAQEAHPDNSYDTFLNNLTEQKKYGASLVWIGHNNPGSVDKKKPEPGLSYAVYEALKDEKSPLHQDAVEQAAAVKRLLDAARQEGLKAVLAIGYQIQMGPVWDERHPQDLRRQHDGPVFTAGGLSASYLSPVYQQDIRDYYRWVEREWVVPYKDVILMLNLADEPHGGDYSSAAEAAFKSESGLSWAEAAKTPEGEIKLGHFQNLYIANYARWSALLWKTIDPSIRVTMSFCGSHGRFTNFEPSIAAIFRDTPDNFDVTFDAFLIDNQPGDPIDEKHVSALAMFLRQVGALSQMYNKRVWLWPEANNWILSQWSPVKGNISDALFGVTLLRNMSAAAGIHLGGLAVWNLDVEGQGLFRDTHPTIYNPQRMFDTISADFKTEADPVRLRNDLLVWIPESEADHLIGRKEYDYAERIYALDLYGPLLERGLIPNLSSDNEPSWEGVKTVFLIGKYPPRLEESARRRLDNFVRAGGTLVTNYPVIREASRVEEAVQWIRFYWNLLRASVTRKPRSVTTPLGKGEIITLFGHMRETSRNIVTEIPAEVIAEFYGIPVLPVDAGAARGLLSFQQKNAWLFYNTNPDPVTVILHRKSPAVLVEPDGTDTVIPRDTSQVLLPHGAWLKLANESPR